MKLSKNAIGMLMACYRAVYKNMLNKNRNRVPTSLCLIPALAVSLLLPPAAPALASVSYNGTSYSDLETLRQNVSSFQNGDVIIVLDDDASLRAPLNFNGKSVTLDFQNQPVTIQPALERVHLLTITSGEMITLANTENIVIKDFQFSSDHGSDAYGGAVYVNGGGFTVDSGNFTFMNNKADVYGGAIAVQVGELALTMDSHRFIGNTAGFSGGAIAGETGVILTGNNYMFKDNSADSYGGAIASNGTVKLPGEGHIFDNNTASFGGAILAQRDITLSGSGHVFNNNRATQSGGAIDGTGNISLAGSNHTFSNNAAAQGGAIYAWNDLTVSGGSHTFTGNTASTAGGAIYSNRGNVTLTADSGNITFQGNTHEITHAPNAIYLFNGDNNTTLTLAAQGAHRLFFYDPIESNGENPNLTVNINAATADTGAVLFDTYQSRVYGDTTVHNGTMQLANGAGYGADTASGSFTLASGAALLADTYSNRVNASTITLEAGSTLQFDLTGAQHRQAPGATTNLILNGAVGGQSIGAGTIAIYSPSLLDRGQYTLVQAANADIAATGDLYYNGQLAPTRHTNALFLTADAPNNQLLLAVADTTANTVLTWTGADGDTWDSTHYNWLGTIDTYTVKQFLDGDTVIFNDDAAFKTVSVKADGVQIGNMTVNNTAGNNYSFSGGAIGGNGSLTKEGTGTLMLANNNTYTGGTVIAQGTLIAGSEIALGNGGVTIADNATLAATGDLALSGLTNAGLFTFANTGQQRSLTLGSYQGSGTLSLQAAATETQQWSDLVTFAQTPSDTVNVHFTFLPGSSVQHLPTDGLEFAMLEDEGGTADSFTLKSKDALAGAYQLAIASDDNQSYRLIAEYEPSLAELYSQMGAVALAQASTGLHDNVLLGSIKAAVRDAAISDTGVYAVAEHTDRHYQTGELADVDGNRFVLALAKQRQNTTYGLYGQFFQGNYKETYPIMLNGNSQSIHAAGSLKQHDLGLFAELRPDNQSGLAYQALIRGGRSRQQASLDNAADGTHFDTNRSLFGASLGASYTGESKNDSRTDYYGHLIYTRLGSDRLTDSIGQDIKFNRANSVRLLTGLRTTTNLNKQVHYFYGAGIDYELSGKANAYIGEQKAGTASLKGLSSLIELGFSAKQSDSLTIDAALTGHVGKKRGLSANATASYRL